MTLMSVSDERVRAENVGIDETGVARRGLWRGKSWVVPIVLFSTLLVVTGGLVGAQPAHSSIVMTAHGTLEIADSRAKLEVRSSVLEHVFTGHMNITSHHGDFTGYTGAGLKPGENPDFYGSLVVVDPNENRLINETKTFRIEKHLMAYSTLTFISLIPTKIS